jgi:UDP-glucose 4-epimerase
MMNREAPSTESNAHTGRRAVVTGGVGFIGYHLASSLLKSGYHVTIIDDLSTGRLENIADLSELCKEDPYRLNFVEGSITDLFLLKQLFKDAAFVFHQAAIANVQRSIEDPARVNDVNVTGTLNVLTAARDNGVEKLVFASSCAVYGDAALLPASENMETGPISPYAVSKLTGEHYCHVFQHNYGLQTACLRYFNVYGPGANPDSDYAAVIPRFISLVKRGEQPVIFGDGEQSRDFVYVDDVVEANIQLAENTATGVYNIGSGVSTSINELAALVMGMCRQKLSPLYKESRQGDVKHISADITRAKMIGYSPKFSLADGLKRTISSV